MLKELLAGSTQELDPQPWVAHTDESCCARSEAQDAVYIRFLPRHSYVQSIAAYGGKLVLDPAAYFCVEHRERHTTRTCSERDCATVLLLPRCGFITVISAYSPR